MCKGKKCLGKNETNKFPRTTPNDTEKNDIMNARRWDFSHLFQFAYFTTKSRTSPPFRMREERLIFIPSCGKEI